jgi:hypothetical protein
VVVFCCATQKILAKANTAAHIWYRSTIRKSNLKIFQENNSLYDCHLIENVSSDLGHKRDSRGIKFKTGCSNSLGHGTI